MASGTAKECGICKEEYDSKERCPRILLCGHSLCTNCITQLIQANNTNCPFCRVTFCVKTAQEFKINHSLVDILKEVGATSQSKDTTLTPPTEWLKAFKKDSGREKDLPISQDVRSHIENRMQLNKELREKMEKEILPKITEIETLYRKKGEFLNEENKQLQKLLEAIERNQKQFDESEKKIGHGTSFLDAAALMEEAGNAYSQVKSMSANATDFLSRGEATCHRMTQIIQQSEQKLRDLKEFLTTIDQEELQAIPNLATLTLREPTDPKKLMVEDLRTRRRNSKAMNLAKKGLLFSLLNHGRTKRFAKIEVSERQRLCWHQYSSMLPIAGSQIIEHKHLEKLVDPLSRLVFLDLKTSHESDGERNMGRLYIRFVKDNSSANKFTYLCTGERGSSFANSRCLNVHDEGTGMERFEFNGKIFMPGCTKGECDTDWLAGSIVENDSSQFYIRLHDIKGFRCDESFGKVEDGMGVLRNSIIGYKDNWVVNISDCGIVLNTE